MTTESYILYADVGDVRQLGGKASALARLVVTGLPVPAWFVVSPAAFAVSRIAAQQIAVAGAGAMVSAAVSAAAARHEFSQVELNELELDRLELDQEVRQQLQAALAKLAPNGELVAVRSSAMEEDTAEHSFAGQLESFLNVAPADVAARVMDVWRSGFSPRTIAYRREHGLSGMPTAPAVLVQRMVQANTAGVAFSADPVSGQRHVAVVAAVHGLGEALVAGEREGDSYRVSHSGEVVERRLEDPCQSVLDDAHVVRVAALARQAEHFFARPQDIEWAFEHEQLYLLQSRPITGLARLPDPDGAYNLWDNSNIIESYGGMTTPLTYSFASRAYTEVYQEFCRILGVPESIIQANRTVFGGMIGLIRGRIYYNLLNWYRVLAMLPGFKANRHFMEQMMGVKESLPDELIAGLAQATWRQRLLDRLALLRTGVGLIASFLSFERRKQHFYVRLNDALGEGRPALEGMRVDELAVYFHRLDRQLLHHWDAPLINDFFAMIFYGLLRRLVTNWCGDAGGSLQNDLLADEGEMISAEPATRVRQLAQLAIAAQSKQPGFVAVLRTGTRSAIDAAIKDLPAFSVEYAAYLEKFGDRCQYELKLESPTLYDDPLPLLRAVGQLAGRVAPATPDSQVDGAKSLRNQAEQRAEAALAGQPVRRALFHWVLGNARRRVRDRENLRFERTRVFGRARQILRELGRRFYAADKLNDPLDIFYLDLDEILGFVEGAATCTELRGLAALRKEEFARYSQMPPPAERFATYGAVYQGNHFVAAKTEATAVQPQGDTLQGIGCCPGVVRGRARVVTNPLAVDLEAGDIVVAEHTDPSWVMILPLAAGLLVERGSLLSHAAIVARELGIPAVVSLTGVTRWLHDGDAVEFDGTTGVVRRLAMPVGD